MTTTTITRFDSLLTAEERCELFRTWREFYATRKGAADDFILYALLRGKDPKAGFTAITNPRKLENGAQAEGGWRAAIGALDNAYMDGRRLQAKLRQLFPAATDARYSELSRAIGEATTQLRKGA